MLIGQTESSRILYLKSFIFNSYKVGLKILQAKIIQNNISI